DHQVAADSRRRVDVQGAGGAVERVQGHAAAAQRTEDVVVRRGRVVGEVVDGDVRGRADGVGEGSGTVFDRDGHGPRVVGNDQRGADGAGRLGQGQVRAGVRDVERGRDGPLLQALQSEAAGPVRLLHVYLGWWLGPRNAPLPEHPVLVGSTPVSRL